MYLAHQAVHDPLGLPPDDAFNDEEISILENILASGDDDSHLRQRFAKVKDPTLLARTMFRFETTLGGVGLYKVLIFVLMLIRRR